MQVASQRSLTLKKEKKNTWCEICGRVKILSSNFNFLLIYKKSATVSLLSVNSDGKRRKNYELHHKIYINKFYLSLQCTYPNGKTNKILGVKKKKEVFWTILYCKWLLLWPNYQSFTVPVRLSPIIRKLVHSLWQMQPHLQQISLQKFERTQDKWYVFVPE